MSANFDSFDVYYSTNGSTYLYYQTFSSSETPEINNLSANSRYYFKIVPKGALSTLSGDTYTFTNSTATTLPLLTNQLIYSIDSSNALTIKWDGSYNKAVVHYSTDLTNYTYYNTYTSPVSTASVSGLLPNTQYYFMITPKNTIDVSGAPTYVMDDSAVTLGYIQDISAIPFDTSSITLTWSGIYSSVDVSYSSSLYTYTKTITTPSTSTASTVSEQIIDLSSGTLHTFQLYPYNSYNLTWAAAKITATTNTKIPTINLKAYYTFNTSDVNGTSILNKATGSYDATIGSTSGFNSSIVKSGDRSIYVNGNSAYTATNSSISITAANGYTISIWVYVADNATLNDLQAYIGFSVSSSNTSSVIHMQYGSNNTTSSSNSVPYCFVDGHYLGVDTKDLYDGKWHHNALTFSGSTDKIVTYYIDGELANSRTITTINASTFGHLRMGWRTDTTYSNDQCFTGYIDEVRIYNSCLSASDIKLIYDNT